MKYEEFEARAKSAFDDCSEMKRMLWNMQTVVAAVPDMVRKNERLDRERAELRQENAALKAELDDWKGNAEGFEPDAYMRLPVDADGAAIRPGDKSTSTATPKAKRLYASRLDAGRYRLSSWTGERPERRHGRTAMYSRITVRSPSRPTAGTGCSETWTGRETKDTATGNAFTRTALAATAAIAGSIPGS